MGRISLIINAKDRTLTASYDICYFAGPRLQVRVERSWKMASYRETVLDSAWLTHKTKPNVKKGQVPHNKINERE
jgi:hypothetical protein